MKEYTLLVDGDNLLTIGFYGLKNHYYEGKHIGGIYHFINTLRKMFESYSVNKICVFWDGDNSSYQRRQIYPYYKENRSNRLKSEEERNNYNYQRNRIKQYLEELYVRQGEFELCETDDCIAFYVQNSDENIIIYSSDRDLFQLLNERVKLYNPSHTKLYSLGDVVNYDHEDVLVDNVKLIKIICGDLSDNIYGIRSLGIKRLITIYPEIKTTPTTLNEVISRGENLLENDNNNYVLKNLINGVTKWGALGEHFFETNNKIIDLSIPFLTDGAKEEINDLITQNLDKEGRSYKNAMKFMVEDGIFLLLPKQNDAWVNFLTPFLKLTRNEKNKHIYKIKK